MRGARPSGKVNPAVILLAFLLLFGSGIAWLAFGQKGPKFPANAGVLRESFGTGLQIGATFQQPKSGLDIVAYSPEELANHNLYKEHPVDRDLVAVIVIDEASRSKTVQGLRAYLGKLEAEGDRATLNGQFAANLSIDEVKQMYGEPFSVTPEQNGRVHLVYYFADPTNQRLAYKLTTSHDYSGKIFSMALEQVLAPQ